MTKDKEDKLEQETKEGVPATPARRVQAEQATVDAAKSTPTPTQAELDAIVRGEKVQLAPDGSPEQHSGVVPSSDVKPLRRPHVGDAVDTSKLPPTPTQAEIDALAQGQHPEGVVVPRDMKYNPPGGKDEDDDAAAKAKREKDAESDGDKAAYKTREAHPDKHRGGNKEKSK